VVGRVTLHAHGARTRSGSSAIIRGDAQIVELSSLMGVV
jgi:hypothetical protein